MALTHPLAMLLLLLIGDAASSVSLSSVLDERTVAMEAARAADAALRENIRNRPVAREKVAPKSNITGIPLVHLNITMFLLSVFKVDDSQQVIETVLYVECVWQDSALAWNASEHGGVELIELSRDALWTPQLRVLNSMQQSVILESNKVVMVHRTGTAIIRTPVLLFTACPMDMTHYPFDQQVCNLIFYSFDDNMSITTTLDKQNTAIISKAMNLGNEWDLTDVAVTGYRFTPEDDLYPRMTLSLKRRKTFHLVVLVIPMVLTSYMNLLVFLLPLQSGEKIGYLVTISVSTSVFISYFTDMMPRGMVSVPNLMKLLVAVNVESLLILLATIFVLCRHHRHNSNDTSNISNNYNGLPSSPKHNTASTSIASIEDKDTDGKAKQGKPFGASGSRVFMAALSVSSRWKRDAEFLDKLFFVVFLTGNTAFLLYLLLLSVGL